MELDLPRDELIEWIGKQLAMGIRNVPPPASCESNFGDTRKKLDRLFELKKMIVKSSREASDKAVNVASERWRSIELKHSLIRSECKSRKLEYQFNCIRNKEFDDLTTQWGTRIVELTGSHYDDLVVNPSIEAANELTTEAEKIWTQTYSEMNECIKRREREESMISKSLSASSDTLLDHLGKVKTSMTEDLLHERYLLKKQGECRKRTEASLRDRIAALSAELHTVRDIDRVKQGIEESRLSSMNKKIEENERMLEWQLIEEQVRLEKEIRDIELRYKPKIERIQRELIRTSDIAYAESEFVAEKKDAVEMIKQEIADLRAIIKEIETAVSSFRTQLRKEEKLKREHAKALRE